MFFLKKKKPINWQKWVDDDIAVKTHPRAKRLTLRHQPHRSGFSLTIPKRTSKKDVLSFLEKNKNWIQTQRQKNKQPKRFEQGTTFLFHGSLVTIHHKSDNPRRQTKQVDDILEVHGDPDLVHARVVRFCKKQAKKIYADHLKTLTDRLEFDSVPITIRDPKTRWGSCHSDGRISLSWRLVLAPVFVMNYVIAHEATHLVHMDHSSDFWTLCHELDPNTDKAETWLKKQGSTLYQWGA